MKNKGSGAIIPVHLEITLKIAKQDALSFKLIWRKSYKNACLKRLI
jgi:hypothetical protein